MLSQIKNPKKEKKAMSALVGYVLLVSFVILMSTIIYNVVETYVPKDLPECPEGVSIFAKEVNCIEQGDGTFKLNLTLKNNGRFNIGGYFIYATNESNQTLATWNISGYHKSGGIRTGEAIVFRNLLGPSSENESIFILPQEIFLVEIIPVRFDPEFISCGDAKIKIKVDCGVEGGGECINDNTLLCPNQDGECLGSFQICTDSSWPGCDYVEVAEYGEETSCFDEKDNDCDGYIDSEDADCGGVCTEGSTQPCFLQFGVCADSFQICTGGAWPGCVYTGITGYEAGTETLCEDGFDNDCDGKVDGVDEDCILTSCGDGIIQTPNGAGFNEKCDDGNTDSGDGCSAICTIETGWSCEGEPSVCTSCDGVWNPPESVECDGDPLPANCLVGCTCAENYIPDEVGGCKLDLTGLDSCKSYCVIAGYDRTLSGCTQNCVGSCPSRICEEGGNIHCESPTPSCCCIPTP